MIESYQKWFIAICLDIYRLFKIPLKKRLFGLHFFSIFFLNLSLYLIFSKVYPFFLSLCTLTQRCVTSYVWEGKMSDRGPSSWNQFERWMSIELYLWLTLRIPVLNDGKSCSLVFTVIIPSTNWKHFLKRALCFWW